MALDETLTACGARTAVGRKALPFIIGTISISLDLSQCLHAHLFEFSTNAASTVGVGVGAYAVASNLGVYLIDEYNFEPVDSTLFTNIVSGFTNFAPFVAAIVFDACVVVSCFAVISAACVASALGMLLFTLTASLPFLRPLPCSSGTCEAPTTLQIAVLCIAIALLTLGVGGTRFTAATMGAAQFDDPANQATVFSWYAVGLYVSSIVALTTIVYIQGNLGWDWGFGLCMAFAMVGLLIFLLGNRYYRHPKPEKSQFLEFLHGIVSKTKKRTESTENQWHYNKLEDGATESQSSIDCSSSPNGATKEQVNEAEGRTLLRLVPLISTGIIHNILYAVQLNIFFLQALVMDRCLGANFTVPVASMGIFLLAASALSVPLLDHVVYPAWGSIAGSPPTSLQRVGLGLFISFLAMVYGALEESLQLHALTSSSDPTSVSWLVPCMLLAGFGEALIFPGQLAFYFQEFPMSLKGSAVAVGDLQNGKGAYMSSAITVLLRRLTGWIQDDGNNSRLDIVYWLLAGMAVLDFVCLMLCAKFYRKPREAEA